MNPHFQLIKLFSCRALMLMWRYFHSSQPKQRQQLLTQQPTTTALLSEHPNWLIYFVIVNANIAIEYARCPGEERRERGRERESGRPSSNKPK